MTSHKGMGSTTGCKIRQNSRYWKIFIKDVGKKVKGKGLVHFSSPMVAGSKAILIKT